MKITFINGAVGVAVELAEVHVSLRQRPPAGGRSSVPDCVHAVRFTGHRAPARQDSGLWPQIEVRKNRNDLHSGSLVNWANDS